MQRQEQRHVWKGLAISSIVVLAGLGLLFLNSPPHASPVSSPHTFALAEIGDNQPFYADLVTVGSIAQGEAAGDVRVYQHDPHDGRDLWRLTKHGGEVYLQAYMRMLQPPDKPMALFYDSSLGSDETTQTKRITLPLKTLHWRESLEDDADRGAVWVSNVRPDRHVWEKW